ncbi:MAG: hypothetical protein ACPGSC_12900 [Granulosicoccaceae bacterium]
MFNVHQHLPAWRVFLIVTVICLLLGAIIGTVVPNLLGVATNFGGQQHDGYLQIANMLAQGQGFRFEPGGAAVMHRPPLYPILLLPFTYTSLEVQKILVIALNCLLAGISATLLYKFAIRFYNKPAIGWLAIGLYLISPWLWRLITLPHTALLQSTLYLAAVYCLFIMVFGPGNGHAYTRSNFRWHAVWFGTISGLLSLTHGIGFLIFAACLLGLGLLSLFKHPNKLSTGSRMASIALSTVLGASLIAPWTLRNLETFPITVPVTTGASFNYFMGDLYWGLGDHAIDENLSQQDNALIAGGVNVPAAESMQYWGVMDPAHEKTLSDNMKAHALANPGTVLHKSLLSLAEIFFPAVHQVVCHQRQMVSCEQETWYTSAHRYGISLYYGFIILLALVSVAKRRTPGRIALFLFALGGLHIGPFLPLGQWAPHGIYALSAVLLIMVLAADGLIGGRIEARSEHIDL